MDHTHDVLVLGHGLAGAAMVAECQRRGLRTGVLAEARAGQASRVAAGVVNPVVLRRYVPSWRSDLLLPEAEAYYHSTAHADTPPIWHPLPLVELFANDNARHQWTLQQGDPARSRWMAPATGPEVAVEGAVAPFGHGVVPACAWLEVDRYLDAQRDQLRDKACWADGPVPEAAIEETSASVRIGPWRAPLLVRCEGPFGHHPALVPVKGVSLLVRIPGLPADRMLHRGVFILPVGAGLFRVGATFHWENVWSAAGPDEQAWLLARLLDMLTPALRAGVEVVDQRAGVRPASRDRRPLLGRITPRQALFNGLGARGVLLAPWCARHLAAHLFDGAPLDPEVDQARA